MNRRNFIGNLLIAGASFAILPGAGRIWRAQRCVPNPAWETAEYEIVFYGGPMLFGKPCEFTINNVKPYEIPPMIQMRRITRP